MTDQQNQSSQTDWTRLAKDALDIWQNHLTSLATDPKAKEEMARFVAPMTEAMSGWSSVMQQGMHQMMKMAAAAAEQAQQQEAAPTQDVEPQAAETAQADAESSEIVSVDEETEPYQQVVTEDALPNDESTPELSAVAQSGGVEQPACEPSGGGMAADDGAARTGDGAESAAESRGTLTPDGSRSLAELAGRLALLERELDQLRPRTRRKDAAESVADGADQLLVGADKGTNTP